MTRYSPQWLQAGSYAASVDRRLIAALWPGPASAGCAVTPASGMQVNIAAGQVAAPSQNNTGSTLCTSDAVEQVTLTAAPASGSNRYDLIICRPRGNDLDGGSNNDFIFDFVTGTAAATPTVPATPAGTVALAQIYVPGASASVTAGNITDVRPGGLNISPAWSVAPVRLRVIHGAQSIARAVWTDVNTWNAPVENVGGTFNAGTGVYTFPTTGRYQIVANLMWTIPITASMFQFQSQLVFTGSLANATPNLANMAAYNPTGTLGIILPGQVMRRSVTAGDTVKVQAYNGHPSAACSLFSGYAGLEIEQVG